MLKFPTQYGVEIYPTVSGLICLKQESLEYGREVTVMLTIGQLRGLVKNHKALIEQAEQAKKDYAEELDNETNS
jgi:hypothetical protein